MSPTLEKASASPLQPRTYPKRWAHQTQALLRKNFFLLWGKKLSLCLALIGPSLAVLLVTLIYSRSDLSPSNIQTELFETKKDYNGLLHWAPSTVPEYSAVVDMFKQALPSARVKGYPTVEAMSEAVMNNWKDRADTLSRETAVSFDSTPEGTVSYKLWKLMEEGYSSAGNYYHYGTNDSYIGSVFINLEELTIQSALETSIISARMNYKSPLQLDLRFGLLPNWRVDQNGKKLDTPFPDYLRPISFTLHYLKLIMTLGFLPLMFLGLQQVTMEKSRKLIGAFRKLGLIDSAYWFSTFFTIQLINLMTSLFSVFVAKACGSIYPLWAEVDFMVLLLTQFMFGFAFSSLGFVIAAGSNRPMLSIALSSVAIVIPAIVQYIQQSMTFGIDRKNNLTFFEHKDLAEVWKFILCFVFSPSIHYGKIFSDFILRISDYAENLSPLTVVNSYGYGDMDKLYGPYIVDPHSLESDEYFAPSTGSTITYLFAEGIIYFFAAWYLMQVVGSQQEYSRPPHFFLLKSYWFGDNKEGTAEIPGTELERKRAESASNKNLVIHKLSKSFKTSTAVQEFSATINRGTICALLGQNGAGKTTVLGMLSALINPTAGHAFINGADLETHPDKFRERLGTCPQDDVLYKHISASEHIRLYATFRGYAGGQAMNHLIMDRLESVGLEKHANKAPGQYSGGMKRRLSVALAFIGDVEMVFLDEPTTGMDPINKRKVWQFIQEEKSNRIVILTTHSMEEADHLGDQICIMHQSRLRAAGTSLYLKNQYGNGYQLTVSTDDVGKIDELVKERLPGASTVATTVGAITISLPKHTLPFLPKFLQRLEILNKGQESESNQTRSEWSLMHTTLESVFFKLCAKENAVDMEGTHMEDNNGQRVSICALCKDRVAEDVVLYTKGGRDVLVSDLICSQCANDDESLAVLPTEPTLMDLDDDLTLPEPLKSVITGDTTPDNESSFELDDVKHVPPLQREPVPIPTYQTLRQAQAVVCKNMTLRMKYKKANFCLLLTVAFLTACYAMVAMFIPNLNVHRDVKKCKDGFYIIGETCDLKKAAMTLARTSNLPCTGDNCIKAELDPRVWYSDGEGQILNTDFDHLKPTSSPDFGRPLPSQKKVDLLDEYMSGQKYIWEHATVNECSPFSYDHPERRKAFLATNFETAVEEAQRIPDVALRFRAFDLNKETPKVSLDYLLPSDYNSNSTIFYNPNCQSIRALYHNSGSYRRMVAATSSLILSKAAGRPQSVTGSFFDANQSLPKRPLDLFTPIAMMIVFPATLVGLLFTVTPPLIEREEGTYQLALMQGIRPFAYWLGMYAYEFLLLGFLALVMTAIGALIENIRASIGSFLALLLVWAHVVIGFSILLSSVLSSPRVARLIVVIVLLVLPFIGGLYTTKPSTGALLLSPPAAFATLFRAIRLDSQDSVLIPLLSLIGVGSVMLIVGVFIHMWRIGFFGNLWQNKFANAADMNNEDDEESMVFDADVLEERRRVAALKGDGGLAVKIQHLKKSYDGITNVVDGISLGLKYGECFGLLGPNGAGKTTTIDMLLGQIKPSSGEILVGGHAPGSPAVRSMVGICPQHDKVYLELTVEENLLFFARIRGATGKTVRSWVQQAAEQVGLDGDCFRKNGGALSGGMRRRLSIAIALMGSPPIIILDEPTTGLDVENRRHIWDMIAKIKAEGNRLVLLTTHSMEEADALSTRLAIQAGGNLQCIGTQMRLKRKFGDGYQLRVSTRLTIDGVSIEEKSEDKIRMESAELTRFQIIEESVRTLCPAFRTVPLLMGATEHRRDGMTVSEKGIARWKVSRAFIFSEVRDLASIFETMEDLKNRQLVEEWGLEQSTIEDVFIRVAGPYMKED